jgi:hypothetical protein
MLRDNRLVDTDLQNRSSHFVVEAARKQIIASNAFQLRHCCLFRSELLCVSLSHPIEPLAPESVLWSEKTTYGDGFDMLNRFAAWSESKLGHVPNSSHPLKGVGLLGDLLSIYFVICDRLKYWVGRVKSCFGPFEERVYFLFRWNMWTSFLFSTGRSEYAIFSTSF